MLFLFQAFACSHTSTAASTKAEVRRGIRCWPAQGLRQRPDLRRFESVRSVVHGRFVSRKVEGRRNPGPGSSNRQRLLPEMGRELHWAYAARKAHRMSKQGIKKFAGILSAMQETRGELLRGDNQDIRLGQLLETAKDAVKHEFCKITVERTSCHRKQAGSRSTRKV